MIMGTRKWLSLICLAFLLGACGDDGRDDTVLDMSLLTGKNWYYNVWLGNKDNFAGNDLLEVLRFEQGGILKQIDFSGRREYVVGRWVADNFGQITLKYFDGSQTVWHVQHSDKDYIQAIVNEQGKREYTTDLGYLGNLTADAFWMNEYTSGNLVKTRIVADVRGNINLREGQMLLADGRSVALDNREFYWTGKSPVYADIYSKPQEVRFYLRIGRDNHLKLRDSLYADNLPERLPVETALQVTEKSGAIEVTWNAYPEGRVYYKVEVLSKDMDLANPYFISRVQPVGSEKLSVTSAMAGELNRLGELKSGEVYVVRLTALLYEPGIDPLNDNYSYANIQAVTYFTQQFLKN